jgi:hypothetical protein
MQKTIESCIILVVMGLCLSLSAQKSVSAYQELYSEAEILANSGIYDVAKQYYFDALQAVPSGRNDRVVKDKIRQKILKMESYQRFYHLWSQAQQLEEMQDFESAQKYYADALEYAGYESLDIPQTDSLKSRLQMVQQTADLCKSLCQIELLNMEGDYGKARKMYYDWVEQAESYGYKWKKYNFPEAFVQKVDSITDFLDAERNNSLVYRSVFPEEYVVMDDYLFQLLNTTACQNPQPIESDITFVVSLDTNGVVEMYINGNQTDNAFNTALLQDVNLRMSQPYRYGFSIPVKEELSYHISSNRTSVWVQKTKKGYVVKDQALYKLYAKEFRSELASAPQGKYLFQIHQNVIDNHALSTVRLTDAKGGKAKKWLKTR